ncbi:MAG: aminoacyl-tRNA hydrolase [Actinomycetota bacterium]|nr:aminoacyl-tRNA hydrolase [Actinomycetota bacterium]
MSPDRWLVVGLGNPDAEYGGTRHNVGAEAVQTLARRLGVQLSRNRRVGCVVAQGRHGDARLVVARPLSYMNESGGPVQRAAGWFKVAPQRIVAVHDDLDLDIGAIRLKRGGGSGGHRGIADIDRRLATRDYLRVRIGIGRPPGRMDPRDYVLRPFSRDQRETIDVALEEACDAVMILVHDGLEAAQNRFHGRAP